MLGRGRMSVQNDQLSTIGSQGTGAPDHLAPYTGAKYLSEPPPPLYITTCPTSCSPAPPPALPCSPPLHCMLKRQMERKQVITGLAARVTADDIDGAFLFFKEK